MANKKDFFDLVNERVIITAEIGINHNGDLKLAEEMIDAAAQCGADAVKFQAFKTEYMYSRLTPGFSHTDSDVFSLIQKLEVQDSWWQKLKERTEKQGLLFSASVFDVPSLELLNKIGIDFVKIASAEINNHEFLALQKSLGDVFVISTGMALLEEVASVVHFLANNGVNKVILLECTSSYPAPPESIHLLNIDYLRDTFGLPVGFSDHTLGAHHAVAAAARGARFIEKHFTLDKNMDGPDQKISSDPEELKTLVHAIREIEQSLKCNNKTNYSVHEKSSREIGRKSVIATELIKKGTTITRQNTIIKRPGLGVPPEEAQYLYGQRAKQDIPADHWITWEMAR
jgi:N,N'-diacetyllegionaminate synthase